MARSMAVRTINRAIRNLDWADVEAQLLAAEDANLGVEACDASMGDWERYVELDNQALKSRAMEWHNGKVYIVELPTDFHETTCNYLNLAICAAIDMRIHDLAPGDATFVANIRRLEPDLSYGLHPRVGAPLLAGLLRFGQYHTLKVEIGVSRG